MWLCLNDAFVSAVEDFDNRDTLVVRARRKEHLKNLLPGYKIIENGGTDYKYRTYVNKKDFSELIKNEILNISYTNFKNSVNDRELHDLYGGFWFQHYKFQK